MNQTENATSLNRYAVQYSRGYSKLCCVVCDKTIDDPEGMYSWPITHGCPIHAVTVVFGCGKNMHTPQEYDTAASATLGWTLRPE